jgi:hypothetical protein
LGQAVPKTASSAVVLAGQLIRPKAFVASTPPPQPYRGPALVGKELDPGGLESAPDRLQSAWVPGSSGLQISNDAAVNT